MSELRERLIAEGVIVPGGTPWGASDAALERHLAGLPCLAIDDAGRAAVHRPTKLTRMGTIDTSDNVPTWIE